MLIPLRLSRAAPSHILEAVSTLFVSPLPPENSGCKAQRAGHGDAMFKRCNEANAAFRE
jgi:hypothetical protein